MAVTIRLQRFGARKTPFYRIVATDSRNKRDGEFLELLGTYEPLKKPAAVQLKSERIAYWQNVGAQTSDTVASLLRRHARTAPAVGN
jgi:small subunit ribosomal protein S16